MGRKNRRRQNQRRQQSMPVHTECAGLGKCELMMPQASTLMCGSAPWLSGRMRAGKVQAQQPGMNLGKMGQLQGYTIPQMSSAGVSVFGGSAISSNGRGVVSIGILNPWESACYVA
jgi:hypothetical protein